MEKRELEDRMKKPEKNLGGYNEFWKERVAYISIIVGLIGALITIIVTLI